MKPDSQASELSETEKSFSIPYLEQTRFAHAKLLRQSKSLMQLCPRFLCFMQTLICGSSPPFKFTTAFG